MFRSTRIKLTAWYLLTILAVSSTFSAIIYRGTVAEVERFGQMQRYRIERRLWEGEFRSPDGSSQRFEVAIPVITDLVEETKRRILYMLAAINAGIVLAAGALGYFLAGRTLRPIQLMVDEQNRFISDASHELKTPLTSLKCAFEVYLRDKSRTKTEADTVIRESIEEVNRLQSLSESLLKLAMYQQPRGQKTYTSIVIPDVISDAVKRLEAIAQKKNITIESIVTPITVLGDPHSLTEVVVILIDNAIKYSEPATVITVTVKAKESFCYITVRDRGIGIDGKDIPHLFERFYRANQARTRIDTGGYGLGLSIAKKIVDLHQGMISVTSKIGQGTVFTVKLPLMS